MGKNKTAACAAFSALAASAVISGACAYPVPLTQTPLPGIAGADDHVKLNSMFHQASVAIATRSADTQNGCYPAFDGNGANGTFKNADISKITALDEIIHHRLPEFGQRTKAYAVLADMNGYKVCYDNRLTKSDYLYTINTLDKVIALDPQPVSGPATPLLAQQSVLAAALENLVLLTNSFTGQASFRNIPQLQNNPYYARLPASVATDMPIGAMSTHTGALVPGMAADMRTKLLPSPVMQPRSLPWELQRALRYYTV